MRSLPMSVLRFLMQVPRALWAVVSGLAPLVRALIVIVVTLFITYFAMLGRIAPIERGEELTLDQLTTFTNSGRVASAVFHDEDARIVLRTQAEREYWVAYPRSDAKTGDILNTFEQAGVRTSVEQQAAKARLRFIAQFLMPLIILASLFGLMFLLISGKGGAADFAAFSKFKRGAQKGNSTGVTFEDVAGVEEAKIELQEIIDYLKNPGRYEAVGAVAPKGALLSGPPGTGKTLLAKAVAGEANVPFFSISGSEFVESLVGVGAARVRDLFAQARALAPAIIFIDELDAAGRQRGAGMGQGNDEREQTLNQLLVEMDGFSASLGVVCLGATNRPDILDSALLRPGRFDRQVVVDAPDIEGRTAILELYARKRPMHPDCELRRIAAQCPGFTGAELSGLMNEAALLAVRAGREQIVQRDMEEAIDRVVAGPERRSHVLTPDEKRLVAYHEAGHAVAAQGAGMETGVQKLSIVARGRSLGHSTTYTIADRLVLSRKDLRRHLVTLMGGAAVEQLIFGETTTGSSGDLKLATHLARDMVTIYGMGESLGRVAVGQKSDAVFVGRDITKMQEVSPATLESVDAEVRSILDAAEREATAILVTNRKIVDTIAEVLLERETFSGQELDDLLAKVKAPVAVSSNGTNGHRKRAVVRTS